MRLATRRHLILGAVACALVGGVAVVMGPALTVRWDLRLASTGKPPEDVVCILAFGGIDGRCRGFVIWREGDKAYVRTGLKEWPDGDAFPTVSITLSGGESVDPAILDKLLEMRYRLKEDRASKETIADAFEYYMYFRKGGDAVWFHDFDTFAQSKHPEDRRTFREIAQVYMWPENRAAK